VTTPNRTIYPLQTEELQLDDNAGDPTEGRMRYSGTDFRMTDAVGSFSPRPSDAGLMQVACETTQTSSPTYVTLQRFIFGGSANWSTPQVLKVISKVASATGAVRVQDVTNALTIAENAAITATSDSIIDLGTISNVPTAEAVWEVQAKHVGSVAIDCYSLLLDFFLVEAEGFGGIRFQAGGVDGELDVTSHEVAPATAPAVTEAFGDMFDPIVFRGDGTAGELDVTSHEVAPTPAPSVTGGPWAFI
jgi:hypothetical protein